MKIIYEKSIVEQIKEARDAAEKTGKKIKRVELSQSEMLQVRKELGVFGRHDLPPSIREPSEVAGIKVDVVLQPGELSWFGYEKQEYRRWAKWRGL